MTGSFGVEVGEVEGATTGLVDSKGVTVGVVFGDDAVSDFDVVGVATAGLETTIFDGSVVFGSRALVETDGVAVDGVIGFAVTTGVSVLVSTLGVEGVVGLAVGLLAGMTGVLTVVVAGLFAGVIATTGFVSGVVVAIVGFVSTTVGLVTFGVVEAGGTDTFVSGVDTTTAGFESVVLGVLGATGAATDGFGSALICGVVVATTVGLVSVAVGALATLGAVVAAGAVTTGLLSKVADFVAVDVVEAVDGAGLETGALGVEAELAFEDVL